MQETLRVEWVNPRNNDLILADLIVTVDEDLNVILDDVVSVEGSPCTDIDLIPDDVIESCRRDYEREIRNQEGENDVAQ
jgi:hypothetical protein